MSKSLTITRAFHIKKKHHGRKQLTEGDAPPVPTRGRIPRISRLMALAIHLDELIRQGAIADQAELARLGRVSRARLTQIMNLLNLAPDIQEHILLLTQPDCVRVNLAERDLRPITQRQDWRQQRAMWGKLHDAGTPLE
jgi:hypothetical protein